MQSRRQTRSTTGRHSADSSQAVTNLPPAPSTAASTSAAPLTPDQPSNTTSSTTPATTPTSNSRKRQKRKSEAIDHNESRNDSSLNGQDPTFKRVRTRAQPAQQSERPDLPNSSPPADPSTPSKVLTRSARKRARFSEDIEMSGSGKGEVPNIASQPETPDIPSTRKSNRSKKSGQSTNTRSASAKRQANEKKPDSQQTPTPATPTPAPRKSKRKENNGPKADAEVKSASPPKTEEKNKQPEDEDEEMADNPPAEAAEEEDEEDEEPANNEDYERDVDDEEMYEGFSQRSLTRTIPSFASMLSGIPGRLREIQTNLKNREDITVQMVALQELSEILLMANEDSLSGNIATDQFVKELVAIMSEPDMYGSENPELMLLACRCLANLMEALPSATSNVVYGGAVPVLCQKLLEIQYIDLAEQALSTLEKISHEYPTSIIREGGLAACLNFLDFFATNVQRTAVTTAANCCRNIPEDSFATVRDVMPVLLGVLNSSDQKVVEQGCLCVSRIIESFRHAPEKLEEVVSKDLLRAILQLLLPGTTNLVGPHIHTQFIRVLNILARSSPKLSVSMFEMSITDTLYQIMTGVSPPSQTDEFALKVDRIMVMQALIHRPKEQVTETLSVITELLPALPEDELFDFPGANDIYSQRASPDDSTTDNRLSLLESCQSELRRFTIVLMPTLTDTYSSTVNLIVRQKVLHCQLKMIVNLDVNMLTDALKNVEYASFLASILSQKDHSTLVAGALQISELLLRRLPQIYRYHFHREGVISEIRKLAEQSLEIPEIVAEDSNNEDEGGNDEDAMKDDKESSESVAEPKDGTEAILEQSQKSEDKSEDENEGNDDEDDDDEESESGSDTSSIRRLAKAAVLSIDQWIIMRARKFIDDHDKEAETEIKGDAEKVLQTIKDLVESLATSTQPKPLFQKLAEYFKHSDSLSSMSSFELSHSKLVDGLLKVLTGEDGGRKNITRREFLEVFMASSGPNEKTSPFTVLVTKLQDLLSRSEHFEVNTVHHNAYDGNRSAASMLAKQLRLKLVADENSEIPKPYRNIMVSIHAIATFKALDDYLRPRISLSEQPRLPRGERGSHLSSALAAFAAAAAAASSSGASGSSATPPQPPPDSTKTPTSTSSRTKKSPRSSRTKKNPTPPQAESSGSALEAPAKKDKEAQAPSQETSNPEEQLECMDERQMSEQEELEEMNALLEDLDQEMADSPPPDPGAVNMDIAGGRVTARKDDGTKIATPVGTPSRERGSGTPVSSLHHQTLASSRPISYAAAAATPPDWHIEFSIGDRVISNDTTIYGAVNQANRSDEGENHRSVWSSVYTIKFRRANGPAPAEPSLSPTAESSQNLNAIPPSVEKNKDASSILHLLSVLHSLNANIDDVFSGDFENARPHHAPSLSQFVNNKLTAKLNRQLEEPLIVASSCLPTWSEELARYYPFLFPFETRFLFLQSTSFGYSRSMNRWQSATSNDSSRNDRRDDNRPFLGRLQRQKVRISRHRIFDSAVKVMELYGASPSVLEVEYFEEVGTGLGPTLEFYSNVSREFAKKSQNMWRESDMFSDKEYTFGAQGLFPAPMDAKFAESETGKKVLQRFKILGKFVARAMLDSRLIDVSFNPNFFRGGEDSEAVAPSLGSVKTVDKGLAQSLNMLRKFALQKTVVDEMKISEAEKAKRLAELRVDGVSIDDLALDFTLPGYPHIELAKDGANKAVDIYNVREYVEKVIELTLGSGVERQVDAFRAGFSQVFPYAALRAFTPDELVMMFGRVEEDWSLETLMDSIKADHGFNMDSKSVRHLLQVMSGFSLQERREFLQFVTGSPKLPIGGFKNLTPMFTVVCKPSEPPLVSDDYLPSVMTCVNYLKLPDYTSIEVLKQRLHTAVHEGSGAFHLS